MNYIITIGLTIALSMASWFGIYNYAPIGEFSVITERFGTTLTTLNSTDSLSDFPTTYNANLAALNAGKIEISTTTLPLITTLTGLTTIGTLTTGVWNATAIGVGYGGTGTTSPTTKQIMFGNGSSGFQVIGFGTNGQFLTSAGDATIPSWTTSAVDLGINYDWTGTYFGIKNLHASSTVANPIYLNGIDYAFPSSEVASSTTLMTNGSGSLMWGYPIATTTTFTSSGTWAVPAGVSYAEVIVVGGGGGGGGVGNSSGDGSGGGGGSGGYATAIVAVSGTITVTVGAAGTAGDAGGAGGNGGNSSFAGTVTVTANGGTGGALSNGATAGAGGAGGATTNGQIGITGQAGSAGMVVSFNYGGGGGSNPLGQGAFRNWKGAETGGNGATGGNYGAGGSGGCNNEGGVTTYTGGAGAAGIVIVKWIGAY